MSRPSTSPTSQSTTQQSLHIVSPSLYLRREQHGHITVLNEMPSADSDTISISETDSEVGKPSVTFPRERDHYTVTRYRWRKPFQHSSYTHRAEIKAFGGQIDAGEHPDDAEWIQHVITRLEKLSELDDAVSELDTYDDLVNNSRLVREYEATYRLAQSVWEHDSLASYAAEYTARPFRIKHFPQGFYTVPAPHHDTVRGILDKRLSEHGHGNYSVAWGGFIVSPADFTAIHEHVKPAYHLAEDNEILSRETLARSDSN